MKRGADFEGPQVTGAGDPSTRPWRKSRKERGTLTWWLSAKENLLTAELILPTSTENVKLGQPRHFLPFENRNG